MAHRDVTTHSSTESEKKLSCLQLCSQGTEIDHPPDINFIHILTGFFNSILELPIFGREEREKSSYMPCWAANLHLSRQSAVSKYTNAACVLYLNLVSFVFLREEEKLNSLLPLPSLILTEPYLIMMIVQCSWFSSSQAVALETMTSKKEFLSTAWHFSKCEVIFMVCCGERVCVMLTQKALSTICIPWYSVISQDTHTHTHTPILSWMLCIMS